MSFCFTRVPRRCVWLIEQRLCVLDDHIGIHENWSSQSERIGRGFGPSMVQRQRERLDESEMGKELQLERISQRDRLAITEVR